MRGKRLFALCGTICLALILVTLPLATACEEEETTTPTTPTQPTTPPTGPQYGGTLKIICRYELTSMGWVSDQIAPEDYYQRVPAIETLVRWDEDLGVAVPFLAESVVEDPEALTITFYLREGVKFHDGTVFDADACIWNFEQLWESANLGASWFFASEIEKVDDYTVRVHFAQWDRTFLVNMCYDSGMISPTAYEQNGLDWVRDNAVGTGPFKQVSFQRDVGKVFERFDDYWQEGKPYLDRIEINIIADPTVQVASFLSGDNDIITYLDPTDAKNLEDEPGVVITQGNIMGDTFSLVGDSAYPDSPFADLRVRQAVSYAINREEIADFIYHGYAVPTCQMVGPANWAYSPDVVGYPYDPDKARALLAEAAADGVFTPNAQGGFDTTIWCRPEQATRDMYTAVQGHLADVGIIADLQVINPGKYGEMYYATGWSDGMFGADMMIGWGIGVHAGYFLAGWSPLGMPQSITHPEEVDEGIGLVTSAPDFETEKAQSWNLEYLLIDKYCLYTPIIAFYSIAAKTDNVHDEQTSTVGASGIVWTFADAWLEE
jgi:peptide/nickel transport system substrate-binding protein